MKYNKSNIMKRAWELKHIYRRHDKSLADCLRMACREAKQEAADHAYDGVKFEDGMTITMDDVTRTLSRWTKYNMDRVYINYGDRKNDGYVDLISRKLVGGNKYGYLAKIVAAVLTMQF